MNAVLAEREFICLKRVLQAVLLAALLCCSTLSGVVLARSIEPVGPAVERTTGPDAADVERLIADIQVLADDFNLTPAQRALIAMRLTAAAPQAIDIARELGEGRRSMNDALLGHAVDPAAIERLAASQGRSMADLSALAVDTLIAVRRALTDQQRQLLVELRALLEGHFGEMAGDMKRAADRRGLSRVAMRRAGAASGNGLDDAGEVLRLTPEQRAEIRAIVDGAVPEALSIAANLAANRNALLDLVRNAPDQQPEIDALIGEQAVLFESLSLLRADVVLQVREVLNDDQLGLIAHLRRAIQDRLAELVGGGF